MPTTLARIEQVIGDLLADSGLRATLITIQHEPSRWVIVLRGDHDRVFDIKLPDTITVSEARRRLAQYLLEQV